MFRQICSFRLREPWPNVRGVDCVFNSPKGRPAFALIFWEVLSRKSVFVYLGAEGEMATHSSILAWEIPWTEEPGGLQSMRSQGVRPD